MKVLLGTVYFDILTMFMGMAIITMMLRRHAPDPWTGAIVTSLVITTTIMIMGAVLSVIAGKKQARYYHAKDIFGR